MSTQENIERKPIASGRGPSRKDKDESYLYAPHNIHALNNAAKDYMLTVQPEEKGWDIAKVTSGHGESRVISGPEQLSSIPVSLGSTEEKL